MTALKITPAPVEVPKLWSVERLAQHWSMKPDSIRAMARRGEIPFIKLGRKVMFEPEALVRFLEDRKAS